MKFKTVFLIAATLLVSNMLFAQTMVSNPGVIDNEKTISHEYKINGVLTEEDANFVKDILVKMKWVKSCEISLQLGKCVIETEELGGGDLEKEKLYLNEIVGYVSYKMTKDYSKEVSLTYIQRKKQQD